MIDDEFGNFENMGLTFLRGLEISSMAAAAYASVRVRTNLRVN